MKLIEALEILRQAPAAGAEPLGVCLACGFMPDRFQTFLAAHLRKLFPEHRVTVEVGLYGDCLGNLERVRSRPFDAGAVVLEWSDFDPRLGIRSLGGWEAGSLPDILETVGARATLLHEVIAHVADDVPLAICLPTLPLPPVSYHPGRYLGSFELQLRDRLSQFAVGLSQLSRVKMVNPQLLDRLSPPGERLDVPSELVSGFPYRLPHASVVAELLARIIRSPVPKKGLITDLDNTLWRGILGDDGPQGISWDLDHGSYDPWSLPAVPQLPGRGGDPDRDRQQERTDPGGGGVPTLRLGLAPGSRLPRGGPLGAQIELGGPHPPRLERRGRQRDRRR